MAFKPFKVSEARFTILHAIEANAGFKEESMDGSTKSVARSMAKDGWLLRIEYPSSPSAVYHTTAAGRHIYEACYLLNV